MSNKHHDATISEYRLRGAYHAIRSRHIDAISKGTIASQWHSMTEPRWGVSLVLMGSFPAILEKTLAQIRLHIGRHHTFYNAVNWHVTLRSLESPRGAMPPNEHNIPAYIGLYNSLPKKSYAIDFEGLASSDSAVMLCGYPRFDLAALRGDIHDTLAALGLVAHSPEPSKPQLRDICHATLAIYEARFDDAARYALFLKEHVNDPRATVVDFELKLVKYVWHKHYMRFYPLDCHTTT